MKTAKKRGKVKRKTSENVERLNSILVENFVSLQRTLTNLTVKLDSLSNNITKLLQLFEISARSFADKLAVNVPEIEKDREFLDKLNALLEQNKVIAKGLTLMEEKMRERLYGQPSPPPRQPMMQPRFSPPAQTQKFPQQFSREGYLPSSMEKKEEESE